MVIAIMGGTFERVDSDKEAYIYRSKLGLIINNHYRFSQRIKDNLDNNKYMLAIEIDPDVDPIEKNSQASETNQRI